MPELREVRRRLQADFYRTVAGNVVGQQESPNERSRRLLMEHLTPDERRCFQSKGYIDVRMKQRDGVVRWPRFRRRVTYRIRTSPPYLERLDRDGFGVRKWCITQGLFNPHTLYPLLRNERVPPADMALSVYLLLRADPDRLFSIGIAY